MSITSKINTLIYNSKAIIKNKNKEIAKKLK